MMYLLIRENIERASGLILVGSKLPNLNKCTDIFRGKVDLPGKAGP